MGQKLIDLGAKNDSSSIVNSPQIDHFLPLFCDDVWPSIKYIEIHCRVVRSFITPNLRTDVKNLEKKVVGQNRTYFPKLDICFWKHFLGGFGGNNVTHSFFYLETSQSHQNDGK